jgi:hypothetical protein
VANNSLSLTITGGKGLQAWLQNMAGKLGTGGTVSVGFLEGVRYPGGDDDDTPGLSVAQAAFWNEFGTSRAPARPFFRTMISKQSPAWGYQLGQIAKATNYDSQQVLNLMGRNIQGQLVESINEWQDPPNAPYTVKRKGFNKPLVHTGYMRQAVSFVVTDEPADA